MANDGKDQTRIVTPDFQLELPDIDALMRHGGMTPEAANLTTIFEFGRRNDAALDPKFSAAMFIGGTPELTETFGARTPVNGAPGIVYKASTLVLPTEEQVKAFATGAPIPPQKLTRQ